MYRKTAAPKPRFLAAVAVLLGAGLLAGHLPIDDHNGWPLVAAIGHAGQALHAEYGSLGALGGLVGSGMRIPVAAAACETATADQPDCSRSR